MERRWKRPNGRGTKTRSSHCRDVAQGQLRLLPVAGTPSQELEDEAAKSVSSILFNFQAFTYRILTSITTYR